MDLRLVSGEFLKDILPKQDRYLLKYFKSEPQQRFLMYYLQFANLKDQSPKRFYRNFIDHTGIHCTVRAIQKWTKRYHAIQDAMCNANERFDFETINRLKLGRFKIKEL